MARRYRSLPGMFFDAAQRRGDATRYLSRVGSGYVAATWNQTLAAVEEIASGLLGLGCRSDDRVAILAATRHEWLEADFSALALGCLTIPIYPSSLPAECGYIMLDSGARVVFAENVAQAEKIKKIALEGVVVDGERRAVPVDHIVVFDGESQGCMTLDELRRRGREELGANRAAIEAATAALDRDRIATIVYTSGTTGLPKGVVQTHGNHLAALESVADVGAIQPGEIDFAFLPLAHSFGRMLGYYAVFAGTTTAYAAGIDTLLDDLAQTRPHLVPSVPRIFEKVYTAVQQQRAGLSWPASAIFDAAVWIGEQRAAYVNRGEAVPVWLTLADSVAHALVFEKIHARFGGRVRYMMSGGAPLSPEINQFFHSVGLTILEGYGLTETTPILTCNTPGHVRIGTVGRAVSGVELKLAGDGEILGKGPNIALGYYHREAETAEAWDNEGWFHTGDIGEIDEDGFLRITDRKKELIKTAGGKYVAPQKIENMLKSRPLISQAVVVGDRLKYCVGLITVEPDTLTSFAASQGLEGRPAAEILSSDELRAAIDAEVAKVNAELASFESIKYFRILPNDFTVESGELTPSLKIKRKVIAEKYADLITEMVQ